MKKKLELKIIEFEKILENSKHNELKLKNLNKELISKLTQINIQQESIEDIIENSSANLKKSNDSKKNNEIDQKVIILYNWFIN